MNNHMDNKQKQMNPCKVHNHDFNIHSGDVYHDVFNTYQWDHIYFMKPELIWRCIWAR